jgi:CDP-ribitol ribitolphosphotransferase
MNTLINGAVRVAILILRAVYAIMKLGKAKPGRIVFLSRQSDEPSDDYAALIAALRKPEAPGGGAPPTTSAPPEIITFTKRQEKSAANFLRCAPANLLFMLRQLKALSKASVAVTDGYSIPVSVLRHRPELTVIQIWHASGAIKKFGLQTTDRMTASDRKRAKILHMHENYDIAIAPSRAAAAFFAEAFGMDPEQIAVTGTPRLDALRGGTYNKRNEILAARPDITEAAAAGKKIIVYLPTYRGGNIPDQENNFTPAAALAETLGPEGYYIIEKGHPIDAEQAKKGRSADAAGNAEAKCVSSGGAAYAALGNAFSAEEFLSVADAALTDYSSLAIDAALLGVPLFFYLYDIEDYRQHPGLNIDPEEEYGKYAARGAAALASLIDSAFHECYNSDYEARFAEKYIETYDGECTKRLCDLIRENL